jgi:hypothetical protein
VNGRPPDCGCDDRGGSEDFVGAVLGVPVGFGVGVGLDEGDATFSTVTVTFAVAEPPSRLVAV